MVEKRAWTVGDLFEALSHFSPDREVVLIYDGGTCFAPTFSVSEASLDGIVELKTY